MQLHSLHAFLFLMISIISTSFAHKNSCSSSSACENEFECVDEQKCKNDVCKAIRLHNWGGNFLFSTQNIQYPRTVQQVQQIVKNAGKLRALGTRHSFSRIADSTHTILCTLGLNSIIALNASVPSVTVQAGIKYTELAPYLYSAGFALPNLAGFAELSIGGAIQTATHGSGLGNGNLATQIRSLKIVLANGSVANFGPNAPELMAITVGYGAFGVLTEIELNLVPSFDTITYLFNNLPSENFYNNFDAIQKLGYTVHVVTTLANTDSWDQLLINIRTDREDNVGNLRQLYGATRSYAQQSTVPSLPATYIVQQNVKQPWYYGLVAYRFGHTPADGNKGIHSEYFVPYAHAVPAIKVVIKLSAKIKPLLTIMLIRTIKCDNFWLSTANGGNEQNANMAAIHFLWKANVTALEQLLPKIDNALLPFSGRPHLGKFFTMKSTHFLKTFPKLNSFRKLAREFDPTGKFQNEFLEENIFSSK